MDGPYLHQYRGDPRLLEPGRPYMGGPHYVMNGAPPTMNGGPPMMNRGSPMVNGGPPMMNGYSNRSPRSKRRSRSQPRNHEVGDGEVSLLSSDIPYSHRLTENLSGDLLGVICSSWFYSQWCFTLSPKIKHKLSCGLASLIKYRQ